MTSWKSCSGAAQQSIGFGDVHIAMVYGCHGQTLKTWCVMVGPLW